MEILVIGAGRVGTSVAAAVHGQHNVTVVDLDDSLLSQLTNSYDVLTIAGNGTSRSTLIRAGVERADLRDR